ncbi:MAG: D-isomer specific 2-hydroxyacid dehydrogenase, NAD-binding [Pseudomonas sp.]|jgi:glyoxylate reductase|uniref:2-hydroxyacid dehydrogenase n=1 Tax=Pseudomonas sp. TaxID=306 RepID=UPI00262C94C7|nr:D-glycerate dehydrogenase [Pseudomonas sp.]MDB6049878.1 D-isomer specific 2-hydroxyacid dehydrogenase, NAD-binding [Pseudomonas sp.]
MKSISSRKAFLCRRFTSAVEEELGKRFALQTNRDDSILSASEIAEKAKGSEVLFVTATEVINADVLRSLQPALTTIATLSVGYDHIDMAAARSCGIKVLHTPDVLSDACAEIAMLLVLNACRRGYEADRMVRSGAWQGWAPTQLLGRGLVGRRLCIFGMGRIGRAIATRARGFGLEIHYHNRTRLSPDLEQGAIYHESLDDLLAASDIFLIAAPGRPELKGMLDGERIARMPAGGVVVNISRGDLIDDNALIEALQSGQLFAAGLDVFASEPNIDPRYRTLDNVFLTPHIGSATDDTRDAMGWLLIRGIEAIDDGRVPTNLLS